MTATLTVTAAGAPQSPGGSPPTSPPQPSARDTRAPRLQASLVKTSLSRFLKTRRLSARVASDERAAPRLRLSVKIGSRVYTLATAEVPGAPAGATKTVVLSSSKSRLRRLRGARQAKLTLAVEARDDAGNVGTARARRTLRR